MRLVSLLTVPFLVQIKSIIMILCCLLQVPQVGCGWLCDECMPDVSMTSFI